jgi:hypothetical protein
MFFMCSGFLRSAILASCLSCLMREVIVSSENPLCFISIAKLIRS